LQKKSVEKDAVNCELGNKNSAKQKY